MRGCTQSFYVVGPSSGGSKTAASALTHFVIAVRVALTRGVFRLSLWTTSHMSVVGATEGVLRRLRPCSTSARKRARQARPPPARAVDSRGSWLLVCSPRRARGARCGTLVG